MATRTRDGTPFWAGPLLRIPVTVLAGVSALFWAAFTAAGLSDVVAPQVDGPVGRATAFGLAIVWGGGMTWGSIAIARRAWHGGQRPQVEGPPPEWAPVAVRWAGTVALHLAAVCFLWLAWNNWRLGSAEDVELDGIFFLMGTLIGLVGAAGVVFLAWTRAPVALLRRPSGRATGRLTAAAITLAGLFLLWHAPIVATLAWMSGVGLWIVLHLPGVVRWYEVPPRASGAPP